MKAVEASEKESFTIAETFPELVGKEQQVALRAYRHRENLTQKDLSALTGIPQHHISEMENGKRTIAKERARKLGRRCIVITGVSCRHPSLVMSCCRERREHDRTHTAPTQADPHEGPYLGSFPRARPA